MKTRFIGGNGLSKRCRQRVNADSPPVILSSNPARFSFASRQQSVLLAAWDFSTASRAKRRYYPRTQTPTRPPARKLPAVTSAIAPGGVIPRLAVAREKLDAKDLPGALAIYEEVLAVAGDRADVLVTISGDLGSSGNVLQIIELVAPRYDAERHGPATGLNLLQAYLALRDPNAAQHVLDILFALNRPELEERLFGFSNAIAELMASAALRPVAMGGHEAPVEVAKVSLVSISKPIWFYSLEPLAATILPAKEGKLRRIAFGQLALPGYANPLEAMKKPEDELGRLSRGIPLWLAETFYFSPLYSPIAAIGVMDDPAAGKYYALFGTEWTAENLQQLVDTVTGGLDFIFTGALTETSGDYELVLRVFEVKKFRERKVFTVRWTAATADTELRQLHEQVRQYMEWSPEKNGLSYTVATEPRAWLDTLSASLSLFLADKKLLPTTQLPPLAPVFDNAAQLAFTSASASLSYLTLGARASRLGVAPPMGNVLLSVNPLVAQARQTLNG